MLNLSFFPGLLDRSLIFLNVFICVHVFFCFMFSCSANPRQSLILEYCPLDDCEFEDLHRACLQNDPDELETLLKRPFHPDAPGTSLSTCAAEGHLECLKLLLEARASFLGESPVRHVCEISYLGV